MQPNNIPTTQYGNNSSPQRISLQQQSKQLKLISNDLEIKLAALRMATGELPQQIKKYFYESGIEIDQNRIMMFELLQLSTIERVFEELRQGFKTQLIQGDKTTNFTHRVQFHDILSSQLISLVSVSKFELINMCLIGFDMYVQPFDAILDIVNKLAKISTQIQGIKVQFGQIIVNGQIDKQKSIRKGYNEFMLYSKTYILGFYIQMLEEYLKKAAKVLEKKDREIIFTGILSFYDQIIPIICENKLFVLLQQLSELNFEFWSVSNSFDYFYFYNKLPLTDEFEPFFYTMKKMMDKTLLSNTLTPFIFGVLRHYQTFKRFFQTINNPIWAKYAQAAVIGILLTFKSGSLQFKQMIDLMLIVLQCSTFSPSIYQTLIENINTPFGQQWSDIDPFFRSGLKAGYNSGMYALFHKLTQQQVSEAFNKFKYLGILYITQRNQENFKNWVKLIQPNQEVRNNVFMSHLENNIRLLDPNFSIINIERISNFKGTVQAIQNSQQPLNAIINCIYILKLGGQDLLQIQHFNTFIHELLIFLQTNKVCTSNFHLYLLQDSIIKDDLTTQQIQKIPSLQISNDLINKFTDKVLTKYINNTKSTINIDNLINLQNKQQIMKKYKTVLQKVFLSDLYRLTNRYIEYSLSQMTIQQVQDNLTNLGWYYNNQQLSRLLQNKYILKQNKLCYKDKRPRNAKSYIVKTFNGQLEIDLQLVQLTINSKILLSGLIELIVANPISEQYLNLLIQLINKFPIINYYVMTLTVPTISLKQNSISQLPQYVNFSHFLVKQLTINSKSLIALICLMKNGLFISYKQQNLLKDYLNVNIVQEILRDIQKLSKSINKQKLQCLLTSLYEIIKNQRIISRKYYRDIVPPVLCVLRTLIRISDQEIVTLVKLFDDFVRLSLGSNYQRMVKEIEIEHLRVTATSTISTTNTSSLNFPTIEIVVFYQDQGLPQLSQIQKQREENFKQHQINIQFEKLNIKVVKTQQPHIQQYSILEASSVFVLSPVIQDVIGDSVVVKSQSQLVEKYYTQTYIYPELTSSQLHNAIRDFFINSSKIQYCLYNTSNGFRAVLISLSILLDKQRFQQKQPFKSILKDYSNDQQLIRKCMYLIQKTGYMKFMNQPFSNINNIPGQYRDIKDTFKSASPIIFYLIKLILSNANWINTGFIQRYPSQDVLLRSHQIFYDVTIDQQTMSLVLQQLPQPGVQNISYILHSNSQSLRTYIDVLSGRLLAINLSSQILNFHELIKLTKDLNSDNDFLLKYQDFKYNLQFYFKILTQRLKAMQEQTKSSLYYKHKNGKDITLILDQYYIQRNNGLINIVSGLKQFVNKCSIADILKRQSELLKQIKTLFGEQQVYKWVQIGGLFKQICLLFKRDEIVLPNFIYHNRYNSNIFVKQELKLAEMVENWERGIFGDILKVQTNIQNSKTIDITLEGISSIQSTVNTSYRILKDGKEVDDFSLVREYVKQMTDLKLITSDKVLTIIPTQNKEQFFRFKILGFICANMAIKRKKLPFMIHDDILSALNLQILPWKLIEKKNKKIYDDIQVAISNDISVKQLGLVFQYETNGKIIELLPRGAQKNVTQANRKDYCNLLALTQMQGTLEQTSLFVNGFYKIFSIGAPVTGL